MAQFQSYNKLLVSQKEQIVNFKMGDYTYGYVVHSQYPSYRGSYLSCIQEFRVYVDGEEVPQKDIYLHLNGKQFLLEELKDLYKEYWFTLDKAALLIRREGGLPMGSSHTVKMTMKHLIPYTGYDGNYLVLDGHDEKQLEVIGEVDAL